MVDWQNGAAFDFVTNMYARAAANAEMTARIVGNFLIDVKDKVGIDNVNMHIIGESHS
jgi:hypothetical protein